MRRLAHAGQKYRDRQRTRRCTPGWYIASACIRSDADRALPGAWRRRMSTTFSIGREKDTFVETVLHAGQLVPPFWTRLVSYRHSRD